MVDCHLHISSGREIVRAGGALFQSYSTLLSCQVLAFNNYYLVCLLLICEKLSEGNWRCLSSTHSGGWRPSFLPPPCLLPCICMAAPVDIIINQCEKKCQTTSRLNDEGEYNVKQLAPGLPFAHLLALCQPFLRRTRGRLGRGR